VALVGEETQPAGGRTPVTSEVAARRFSVASPATALVAGGLVLALVAAGPPLSAMAHQLSFSGNAPDALVLVGAVVGVVVAWHQPRNPMGWLLLASFGLDEVNIDASFYSVADYRLHHGALPLGPVAVLLQPAWAPTIVLAGLAILLFPDGRVPSPRWRWVLWVYLAVGCLWLAGAFTVGAIAIIGHNIHVDASGNLLVFDQSTTGPAAWFGWIEVVFFPLLVICWLASLVAQAASWRPSSGERRQQLKWLMGGSAACLVGLAVSIGLSSVGGFWGHLGLLGIAALPVSMGVAILKYRLYDIDRIISRAVAYAIVTGLLIGVYAGLVLLTTQVFRVHTPVAVAASTLAAAALFNPLRRRVQRAVDRRFNRARYDADQTVTVFAARLKDAVDLDAVRDDLASVVHQALEPAHVSLWISQRD
jgi:hypothetical protein